MIKRKFGLLMVVFSIASIMLTGCTSDSKDMHLEAFTNVAVVVGAHSNANVISTKSKEINDQLYKCAYTYGICSLVRCDGKPEEILKVNIEEPEVKGLSETKLKLIAETYREEILNYFIHANAQYSEVDTLEAIRIGANSLRSTKGNKVLLIADSGLSTTGYLNFKDDNLFDISTEDIVNALLEQKALPDLTEVDVIWLYAGQTAEPQEKLSELQKSKLIEIWNEVLKASNAKSIMFNYDSSSSIPYSGFPPVSTVDADSRDIEVQPIKTIILDSESVEFVGDKAIFVDSKKAKEQILKVAKVLKENPKNTVYLCGCTASSVNRSEEFLKELSFDRANAVKSILENNGVPNEQMLVVGMGDDAPWHLNDLDSEGNHIEELAKKNRAVVVLDTKDIQFASIVNSIMQKTKQ